MPYGNKILDISSLLAAWQNRNAMERNAPDAAAERRSKELQNDLMKQQLKENETKMSLILGQGGMPLGMDSPYTKGYPEYALEQRKDKMISQLTGQPLPNMGIVGGHEYGGGWGRGRGSGGGGLEEGPSAPPYSYEGPDHSKAPDTVSVANKLAELYGHTANEPGGGIMKNPETGTFKEFSETPVGPIGKIADMAGNETVVGPAAAADYLAGKAGAEEVNNILKERSVGQEDAKAKALNIAASQLSSYPGFGDLPKSVRDELMANVEKYVTDTLASGRTVVDWGSKIREVRHKQK